MERWVLVLLNKERKKRKQPLEVKKLNNNYYLYRSTTRWDKEKQKIRKVSEYLGRITKNGVVKKQDTHVVRSVYHYGNARLLHVLSSEIEELLKKNFPQHWQELLACAIVKTIRPVPLKLIRSVWETLFLSTQMHAHLSPKAVGEMMREIGVNYVSQKNFFDGIIKGSKALVFDLSSLFSHSENLRFAEKGHNPDHAYIPQINFLLFFSLDKQLPVMLRPLHGSVRDIKALKNAIDEIETKESILVLDRGFASYKLAELLKSSFKFILPLRRDFKIIDYHMSLRQSFVYRKRGVNWAMKKTNQGFLYIFEDVKMRSEEETTFIGLAEEGKRHIGDKNREALRFGKISLLSNSKMDGQQVYLMFKQRESIEVAFDAMKNELENDKTYLHDDDAVRGYFFVSFLSLYLYYQILRKLKEKKLVSKISVNEVLLELSKVYEIHLGNRKKFSEVPHKVEKLVAALEVDIFPKS
ncbi:MAG TPA: transposase [Nanoarchaeota archaeon]|nr:transposase [Nanoarchaeota archaeon]